MTTYRWMLAHIPLPVPKLPPVYPEQDWPTNWNSEVTYRLWARTHE